MLTSTLFTILLASAVSAGPHGNTPRRRHHARGVSTIVDLEEKRDSSFAQSRSCNNGDWQCVGSELQRCNFDTWISIQNCTGENVVCSADSKATGCVWTWSVDEATDTPVTVSPLPPVPSVLDASSISPGSSVDSPVSSSSHLPTSTASLLSSAGPTSIQAVNAVATGDADANNSDETLPIISTSSSAPSPSASVIGGALIAGDGGWSGETSTSKRRGRHSSTGQDWYGASTEVVSSTDAWAPSSSANWYDSSSDAASSTQEWYGAEPTSSDSWGAQSSADVPSSSARRHISASTTSTSSSAIPTGNTPSGSYSAPHYVIYADQWLQRMPDAGDLSSYNRFILAFWMSTSGAVDNAQAWEQFDESYRQQVLDEYHAAGIALMVSAFGSTDSPTTDGKDPTQLAQDLAAWVKQYGLDGVDIDYEDMNAMNNDFAENWLVTFQRELRKQLPSSYLISHAPVAPWFTSGNNYPSGAYVTVAKETGDGVSFWNVQFYNQGDGVYEDCSSLITDSGNEWPDTSVMGIHSYAGIPLDKIVIGKPIDAGAAANGYMDGATLAQCVAQAEAEGWNGGVMFWEWSALIGNSLMAEVRG